MLKIYFRDDEYGGDWMYYKKDVDELLEIRSHHPEIAFKAGYDFGLDDCVNGGFPKELAAKERDPKAAWIKYNAATRSEK